MSSTTNVRQRIMGEHKELRTRIQDLQKELKNSNQILAWRQHGEEFLNLLEQHMSLEDRVLEPVLRKVDAWGEIRSQRFLSEHKSQRKHIAEVRSWLKDKNKPEDIQLQKFTQFLDEVLQDIADEERDALKSDLFKEDVIVPDPCGG